MEVNKMIEELLQVSGITHVLPFKKVFVIDFDESKFPEGFTKESMTSAIKKVVHGHYFNMLTVEKALGKKVIILTPYSKE